ncbi:NAD(P)-dependent oxidoreductase [Mammaliicoccus sciuri]|uniref:NAD-dependent epimerase/dehydratase family protein n=1 Tax=Mammaliicoccus sciuri TaxID=1296 RepID=UPI0030D1A2AA
MNILITGAFGNIGTTLIEKLKNKHLLTITDVNITSMNESQFDNCKIKKLDITNFDECKKIINNNIDIVVHLAGTPNPNASFHEVLNLNIVGTYNVFMASIGANVKKVIFASSAQTIEGYPNDKQVSENDVTKPGNFYGVSKVTSEALASYFANDNNIDFIALRIGAFDELRKTNFKLNPRDLSAYISPEDLSQIVTNCIDTSFTSHFEIINCISDNQYKRLDIYKAKKLINYQPKNDAFLESGYKFDK